MNKQSNLTPASVNTVLVKIAFCLALFGCATLAQADSPSFTFIEFEYIASGDIEVADDSLSVAVDTDGYALTASAELGLLVLQASRFELESDKVLGSTLEDSISMLAIGANFELPQTSLYALLRARKDELSLRGGLLDGEDEDGTSVGFEVGVRVNITDRFEINANAGKPSKDDGSSFGAGVQFYLTDNLGITLDYSTIEAEDDDLKVEIDTTSIGLRYNF